MTRRTTEVLDPAQGTALAGLLAVPDPVPSGDVPLLWHWLHLLERPRQSDLGIDGHPVRGGFPDPPGTGLRRMWAGGRVERHAPLRYGVEAVRESTVAERVEKHGRTGPLTLVAVEHRVHQGGRLVLSERQDLVYRPRPTGRPVPGVVATDGSPPVGDAWCVETVPTLLFRFSALTYNAHRVHYDRDFARDVEGYAGLLVHGPLQAILMAERVRPLETDPERPVSFDYRLLTPLYDHDDAYVRHRIDADNGRAVHTEVASSAGSVTATGFMSGR